MEELCNICNANMNYNLVPDLTPDEICKFRESLPCPKCGSSSRDRIMMWTLSNCISQKNFLLDLEYDKNIKIIEASGQRGHPLILETKFDYSNTEFDPIAIKEKRDPNKYADFQNLHFDDNTFNFILASDVFEHIRLDDDAFSELYRTLKDDGHFIMTVPFSYNMEKTMVRVKPEGDKDIFLMPPEYHAANTLVYRIYGKDIFSKLNSFGFNVCYARIQVPQHAISHQEIFICRKGNMPNTSFLDEKNLIVYKKDFYPIK